MDSWFKNIKAIWVWLIAIVKALVEDLIILIYLKISNSIEKVSSDYSHYQKHLSVLKIQSPRLLNFAHKLHI